MNAGLKSILSAPQLVISQIKELIEIIVDFETANKYEISATGGRRLGNIIERGGGFKAVLKRWFLRSHRPFDIDVFNAENQAVLHLHRRFFFFFSDLEVVDVQTGQKYGSVHRRFGIIRKKYDLLDANGKLLAQVRSPVWRLWTFPVYNPAGLQVAEITKRWKGILSEAFTDADRYIVDFRETFNQWSDEQKAVLFAAAISIDFDFFENNQGSGGLVDFFSP
jgi:hypothetical protein